MGAFNALCNTFFGQILTLPVCMGSHGRRSASLASFFRLHISARIRPSKDDGRATTVATGSFTPFSLHY
ncbi:MAG: hypothetical protein MSA49_00840 [Clostridia bacterium]|nr:hypothetical protein [Clostridia bacterium]